MAPAHMGQGSSVTYSVQPVSRLADGQQLGMGGGVAGLLAQVVRAGHGPAVLRHDRAHGHLALAEGGPGLLQRQPHQGFMRGHTAAAWPAAAVRALLT